ncbi:hypothetical protein FOZ60_011563 [Perkinsus olseni]|uniref:Uncharacterized protein n=1 Tax=Perkinsus olseni TaxID=32597 RepID=A0A7J6NFJ6_PEROL|nr:hypothetical protein FOZ60_011563 [Perkinsus olseni]
MTHSNRRAFERRWRARRRVASPMLSSLACPTCADTHIMPNAFYVPGYRANMEAPLIMPGTYRIIDLDKSKITSLKDLKMDVEAGRQKDSRYIGLNFEHLYGSTYDVQNMSPVISPRYGKQLSGDLRRRCWKVRRTPQFYHLANPVGQMKSVSEAFPEDLSYATLGTTVVCQDDDNTISLGLCKVLGFRKAEYEESDYIFVTLTRWNGGSRSIPGRPLQSPTVSSSVDREERPLQSPTVSSSVDREERPLQSPSISSSVERRGGPLRSPTVSSSVGPLNAARAASPPASGYSSAGRKRKADGDIILESIFRPKSPYVDIPFEEYFTTDQADSTTKEEASHAPWGGERQVIEEQMEDGEIRTYRKL